MDNAKKIFSSAYFYAFMLACAAVITLLGLEFWGVVLFVLIISAILVISDDIMDTTAPFLVVCGFVSICYNSFSTFIKLAPFAVIPAGALIYHYVKYRGKFKIGYSFFGISAVAVAITLGGFGRITVFEYLSPTSIYYTLGLGIGMMVLYVILKSQICVNADGERAKKRFVTAMYLMGIVACIVVIGVYIRNFAEFWENKHFLVFHSRNNYATYLMLAMPFPCYFALKNRAHLLSLALIYGCILLTNSRGGLIFGTVELLICLVYIFISDKKHRRFYTVLFSCVAAVGIAASIPLFSMYTNRLTDSGALVTDEESRWWLLLRSIDDFKSAPLFGVGLGYAGNTDVYDPVSGAMNWYHLMIPQIVGSMGLVGVAAYGYQAFGRFRIWIKTRNAINTALFLSYVGLLLMSQVNPGEFCPLPYEFLAVMIFVLLETDYEKHKNLQLA